MHIRDYEDLTTCERFLKWRLHTRFPSWGLFCRECGWNLQYINYLWSYFAIWQEKTNEIYRFTFYRCGSVLLYGLGTFPGTWTADVCFWRDGQRRKTYDGPKAHASSKLPFQISVKIFSYIHITYFLTWILVYIMDWGRHIHGSR
jgi:hypothetical protein